MNIVQRVIEILAERTVAVVGSLFASRLETTVAIEEARHQDELEERAQQFDDDGKPHLATRLRARASQIDSRSPGSYGLSLIRQLEQDQEHQQQATPLLENSPARDVGDGDAHKAAEPARPKRRARRRPRQSSQKPTDE